MKPFLINEDKKQIAHAIADHLRTLGENLVAAYVFGSFVTADVYSDVDVAILLTEQTDRPLMLELDVESALERVVDGPVDVRVLNSAPISFAQSVIRTGVVILDARPNQRADFEGQVLKKYFDFAPFRARYLAESAHARL